MKVLYIPTLNWAVSQWRIEYPAREMYKQLNLTGKGAVYVDYLFDPRENIAWDAMCLNHGDTSESIIARLNSACKFFDVIVIQKIQSKDGLAVLMGLKEIYPDKLFVAEIDDSIGEITPSNYQIDQLKDHHSCAAYHVQESDAVICSTDYLGRSIKAINENYHVYSNCINYDIWKAKRKRNNTKNIRIGYVAGGAHDEDLLIAYRAMLPIMEEYSNVRFVIRYGGFRPDWLQHKQIDFKHVNWGIDIYPQELANLRLDIGLAPLRDTEFNRCKSNLKWIEMSSLGIPVVASAVEPFNNTCGKIYLTSNNIGEFSERISDCIRNIGSPDHNKIKDQNINEYNIKKEISRLLEFFEINLRKKVDIHN
ncbi:MAG: hypothetical protein UR84_C0022G0001 [candidate division WS6 bacterium GW2011_GWD1_35_594]|nr:MAG: hypothetical protein UR43_C0027G0011 [candidate division TM6 bacterium GW2011_GWF2_33_332]KKP81554.1 MAG: hypothetical protein UR84_C0022G0001 [candidate division WS6 bacterium GW2011_GWD1_35_594]